MRKIWSTVAGLALATAMSATPALAQAGAQIGLGGGISVPLGNFKDANKLGWQGTAMVGFTPAGFPVGFRADGMFSRNSVKDIALGGATSGHTQIISGTGDVVFEFKTSEESKIRPYILGGGGVYNVKGSTTTNGVSTSASQTKFGVNGGAGFNFVVGSLGLFLEGRFNNVFLPGSDLHYIPVTLGVRLGSSHPQT